jgi:hypothetical protein
VKPRDPGPATRAIALAGIVPAVLLMPGHPLAAGGLPGLAGGLLVGAIAGVPAARAEWRSGPLTVGWASRVGDVAGVLAVGAALGPLISSPLAFVVVAAALALVGLALRRWGAPAQRILLGMAGLALLSALAAAAAPIGPWTLLEPRWEAARAAAGVGLVVGALLAGTGFGVWSSSPWIPGVGARRPFAPVGIGALAGLAALVEVAWRAEVMAGVPTSVSLVGGVAAGLLALCAASAVTTRGGAGIGRIAAAILATAWFAWPARDLGAWFWWGLLPLGLAVPLAARAGPGRWLAAALVIGVGLCAPSIPEDPGDAAVAALTVVGAFWTDATGWTFARVPR